MEFTDREKQFIVWLLLAEYANCVDDCHVVAGNQLDFDADDPRRAVYEQRRLNLNHRIDFIKDLIMKFGYQSRCDLEVK